VEEKDRNRWDWGTILLLGVVALHCGWVHRGFAGDDAFITYRYARNIAEGNGFVYNLNESVLGTTTPLYTLWLALWGWLTGQDIRLVSHVISILSLWIGAILLYYLGRGGGVLLSLATSLVFVSNPLLVSTVGMETCFLNLILLSALASYLKDKFALTGVLLGLLVLTRYETALYAGVLTVHFLVKHRRMPFWLASTAAIVVSWMIFAQLTFGDFIPQSALAKLAAQKHPFIVGAFVWWRVYAAEVAWYNLLLPLALLGGYAAVRSGKGGQASLLILAWSGVYLVAASLVAGSFPWYYGPLIPGLSILVVWGIGFVAQFLGALLARLCASERLVRDLRTSVLVALALSFVAVQISLWTKGRATYRGQVVDARYVIYWEAAEWLKRHAEDGQTLATPEIGVLGYYTDMRIIDLYGLVTPSLTPWAGEDIRDTMRRAIELYAPDYVITDKEPLIEMLRHSSEYEPVQRFGDGTYILYESTQH
jgi:hypothetical protein